MLLREVTEQDLSILFEHQREPEGARMAAMVPRDRATFVKHWRENVLADERAIKKVILIQGQVIGSIMSWDHEGKRLVGYWLSKAHWGRGFASQALADFLRDHERTRPVHAFVVTSNIASQRVLLKQGFRVLGAPVIAADGIEEVLLCLDANAAP